MSKIDRVNIYKTSMDFRGDYSISRVQALSSANIVVEIVADQGRITGYGEGTPVEFATGETQESSARKTVEFLRSSWFPWTLNSVSQVWDFVDSLPKGMDNNTAICALESSLLDALGKFQKKSILRYFPKDFYSNSINYGATITLGNKSRIKELCRIVKSLELKDIRIKMDRDPERNEMALATVREIIGEDCSLRIDPNGIWDKELTLKHMPLILKYKVSIVEEPMSPKMNGFQEIARMLKKNGIILMACETAATLSDVERIISEGHYQMINVKLCRSGGFKRSLDIIGLIRKKGLFFQIGCNLGESGILSAAGRALCLLCSDALYYDGSYNKLILKKNITTEHVSFGKGGKAGVLLGSGLGIEVSKERLSELTKDIITIRKND